MLLNVVFNVGYVFLLDNLVFLLYVFYIKEMKVIWLEVMFVGCYICVRIYVRYMIVNILFIVFSVKIIIKGIIMFVFCFVF